MKYYVDFIAGHDTSALIGAVLIDTPMDLPDAGVISLLIIRRLHPGGTARVVRLPRLNDEIPRKYFDKKLTRQELGEIDVLLGGDGTGAMALEERRLG